MTKALINRIGGTAAIKVVNAVLGFGVALVLARALGAEGYGVYTTAFVAASVIAILIQLGLPKLVLRETAASHARQDYSHMANVWRWATRIALGFSLVVFLVGGTAVLLWQDPSLSGHDTTYLLALSLIPLMSLGAIRTMALRGLGHIIWSQLPELVIRPGLLLLLALMLGSLVSAEPAIAMLFQVIAVGVAFAVGATALWYNVPADINHREHGVHVDSSQWLRSATSLAFAGGAVQVNQYADILTLSLLGPPDDVGLYRVAHQTATLASFGTYIVTILAGPLFAKYHAVNNLDGASRTMRNAVIGATSFAALLCALIIMFGTQFLSVFFGKQYIEASTVLVVLSIGQFLYAFGAPMRLKFEMTGREAVNARIHIGGALLNIILNILLITRYGIDGAALATLISIGIVSFSLWFFDYKGRRFVNKY